MPNELVTYEEIQSIGKTFAASGYFQDARDMAQAVVKIMAGKELGLGPVASMTGVYIIKGKPALSANLLAGVLKRSGKYDYRVIKLDDSECEIAFFQCKEEIGRSLFTKNDATKAGTQNLDKYPRNMLFARAMTNGIKWYCPDVFAGGVYTPEELGAKVDGETGEVINSTTPTHAPRPNEKHELEGEPTDLEYEAAKAMLDHKGNAYIGKGDDELLHIANNDKAPEDKRRAAAAILRFRQSVGTEKAG